MRPFLPHSKWILLLAAGGTLLGLLSFATWLATGNALWLDLFFQGPGLILMVGLAAVQVGLSLSVRQAFFPDEPMYLAWSLIGLSAVCDLLSAISVQWLSSASPLDPLQHVRGWSPDAAHLIRQMGLIVGGTFRYALLCAGLLVVLRVYRKAGFLGCLAPTDWVLLGLVLAYLVYETRTVMMAVAGGKSPGWREMLGWPVDPLLFVLLFETRLLARSIRHMGAGAVGHCWQAFTIGILLVWLGNLGSQAASWSNLSWEWAALGWYVWLPAAGAFAIAPAYQLEAIRRAMHCPAVAHRN